MNWMDTVAKLMIIFIAFPMHEFAHAWTADYFGDDTARLKGRLTLNPLKHIDIVGALLLFMVGFGWAKPVPVNETKLLEKGRFAPIATAAAGAVMNFGMMLVSLAAIKLILFFDLAQATFLVQVLVYFMLINVILVVFNLLPIPPLDGFVVLTYMLPPSAHKFLQILRQYGMIILLVMVYILPRFGTDPIGLVLNWAIEFVWTLVL